MNVNNNLIIIIKIKIIKILIKIIRNKLKSPFYGRNLYTSPRTSDRTIELSDSKKDSSDFRNFFSPIWIYFHSSLNFLKNLQSYKFFRVYRTFFIDIFARFWILPLETINIEIFPFHNQYLDFRKILQASPLTTKSLRPGINWRGGGDPRERQALRLFLSWSPPPPFMPVL